MRSRKIDAIVNQTRWCREAFGGGCHAFLHTWSTMYKALIPLDRLALVRLNLSHKFVTKGGFLNHGSRNEESAPRSSEACVDEIRAAVGSRHLTVAIETQVPQVSLEQARPWGTFSEMVDLSMRMQLAGIGGGLALAARHVPCYDALVRMRADVGDQGRSAAKVFLGATGWRNVHRRAQLVARGNATVSAKWAREVVTCGWPRVKRTDFCLWSAPPAPLAGAVDALLGDRFPRTVYAHNCSGFLQDSTALVI